MAQELKKVTVFEEDSGLGHITMNTTEELKAGGFQPEYAGKMNFYLNILDTYVKEKSENASIGIILCANRDKFEVEFALHGIDKPVGVAEYQSTNKLPKSLAGKLPNAKKLKREIMKELKGTI